MSDNELETRLVKVENSISSIHRMESKIDKIAELTAKLATIEEKHHYQTNAIERAFTAIEKNANQIDSLRESFIDHDKYTATAVSDLKEQTFKKINYHIDEIHIKNETTNSKLEKLENELISKISWAKGAWFAASILWVIIQIGMIWALKVATDTISETNAAVIELRIENNRSLDREELIHDQLKTHELILRDYKKKVK